MPATQPSSNPRRRFAILAALFAAWVLVICLRLVWLQVIEHGMLAQRAARQQQRSLDVAPPRGVIYDRNGNELAMTVQVDSIFAVPSEVPDPAATAGVLARVLHVDRKELEARLEKGRSFAWVARKVTGEQSERVHALNLRGIYFQKEPKRFYPKGDLAAQILGYVGTDDEGLGGLERSYDEQMRGTPGAMRVSVDARHKALGHVERQPEPGENVVLTIDEKIQYIAERELDAAMQQTKAETGTVVVQNPNTGEILALANRPTFDPNHFSQYELRALKDRAVSDVYEPGSTFKIVTLSAALEEKLARPEEMIDCQMGSIVVNGVRIHDHKPYGLLSVSQVLWNSSDVGAIKLGMRLGDEKLYEYIRRYGFGQQTGIELPGETRGLARPPKRWSKASIGAISMGQEVGVTPVQLISMVSTAANGGTYFPPRILAGAGVSAGQARGVAFHPGESHRVLSPLVAAEMRKMLEGVVLYGTGKQAVLNGYTSAGKTGTAQKIDPKTHTYSKTKYIATFAGFAPVNTPAISVAVILDSPAGLHQGGQASAPVWARVTQQILEYMNVPHDAEIHAAKRETLQASARSRSEDLSDLSPDRVGDLDALLQDPHADDEARAALEAVRAAGKTGHSSTHAAKPRTETARTPHNPAGNDAPAAREPGAEVATAATPTPAPQAVDTRTAEIPVPSLVGMSLRQAVETAQTDGLPIEVHGNGIAREQSPAAGERLAPGGRLVVKFSR